MRMLTLICLGALAAFAQTGTRNSIHINQAAHFRLEIPAGWRESVIPANFPETRLKLVRDGDRQGGFYVDLFPDVKIDLATATRETRDYVVGELKGVIESERDLTLGDLPAHQLTYLSDSYLNEPRRFLHTLVMAGGNLYLIHGVSSPASFGRYLPDFEAMTSSFRVVP